MATSRPTIKDIARVAGVSVATVSRALRDRPVVAVGERLAGPSSIAIDNRLAARRAVEHLIGLGHERIGLVAGPRLPGLPTPVSGRRKRDALFHPDSIDDSVSDS